MTWLVVLLDVNEPMTTKHQFVIGCSTIVIVYQPHAIKQNLNVIYFYLSPKELHEGEDEHSQRPDEVLGEGGVGNNPRTLKFFLGLITDCADFIKHEHKAITV